MAEKWSFCIIDIDSNTVTHFYPGSWDYGNSREIVEKHGLLPPEILSRFNKKDNITRLLIGVLLDRGWEPCAFVTDRLFCDRVMLRRKTETKKEEKKEE